MLGIIPTRNKTYDVIGYISDNNMIEKELYADVQDGRIYMYSTTETRSGPNTDYFPIYNGKNKITTQQSCKMYTHKDMVRLDINSMSNSITPGLMKNIEYRQKTALNNKELKFVIEDDDNTFTQCIKCILNNMNCTIPDLALNTDVSEELLTKYINQLTKISFMRNERWLIWINKILKLTFQVEVFDGDKFLLRYSYPSDSFDIVDCSYEDITSSDDDYFKKMIKILIEMNGITKEDFKNNQIDDYTINNMMTSIKSDKHISVQIFDRFIAINNLSSSLNIFRGNERILSFGRF